MFSMQTDTVSVESIFNPPAERAALSHRGINSVMCVAAGLKENTVVMESTLPSSMRRHVLSLV